jgi:hypothetical protein
MSRYTLLSLVITFVLVFVVGCGGTAGATPSPATPPGKSVADDTSLVEALRAAGAQVESGDTVEQPFFPVPGKVIKINGQDVQVFVFADETAAQAAAATVPPDGSTFKTMIVDWMAPPHFYQRGRIIALYVGADAATLQSLTTLLGEPFAGG